MPPLEPLDLPLFGAAQAASESAPGGGPGGVVPTYVGNEVGPDGQLYRVYADDGPG